jgi:hypothetical protein
MQPYRAWQAAVASTKGRVPGGVQASGRTTRRRAGVCRATSEGPRGTRDRSTQAGRRRVARSSHRRRLRRRVPALGERHGPVSDRVARPAPPAVGPHGRGSPRWRLCTSCRKSGSPLRRDAASARVAALERIGARTTFTGPLLGLYWAFTGLLQAIASIPVEGIAAPNRGGPSQAGGFRPRGLSPFLARPQPDPRPSPAS